MAEPLTATRRTAFVTGASQGIGAAIAVALARDGYDVALSSRRPEALADVAAQVTAAGARALPVELDVLSETGVEQAMNAVLAGFGQLDVLVNNAGITSQKPALEITLAEWEAVIATNLTGTFFMSQQMGRHLVATKRAGSIINIGSTHGLVAMPLRVAYGSSKGGIMQLTRLLAIEWAEHGIRVNAIAPGRVETASRAALNREPGYRERVLKRIPLGRFASCEDVAEAVCYLASPAAAYITGQTLILDGGLTAQ
jgi:NAD(P)-dependent dehydrogenase (short-subunit alcohol dehydrogenase family)